MLDRQDRRSYWQATGGIMRLICPNCGAQYEVPDDVIPESGRDVQCSNCGDTWFQHHPNHPPTEADAEDEAETVVDEPASPPEPEIEDEPEVAAEAASEDVDESEDAAERDDQEQTDADEDEADEPAAIPPRRELDPAIASILREEAQHEEKERARESRGGIETQPDLGLNVAEPDERAKQARERMARLRGESADEAAQVETVGADDIDPDSRRNLLPDIEEISSSLDADRDHAVPAPVTDSGEMAVQVKSGGFGRGFIYRRSDRGHRVQHIFAGAHHRRQGSGAGAGYDLLCHGDRFHSHHDA